MAKAPAKKAAVRMPDKLTGASVIGSLAEKNVLGRKDVKQLIEDLFETVGTGVRRGESIPIAGILESLATVNEKEVRHHVVLFAYPKCGRSGLRSRCQSRALLMFPERAE